MNDRMMSPGPREMCRWGHERDESRPRPIGPRRPRAGGGGLHGARSRWSLCLSQLPARFSRGRGGSCLLGAPLAPHTASGTEWALNKYPLNLMHLNSTNIY